MSTPFVVTTFFNGVLIKRSHVNGTPTICIDTKRGMF